VTQSEQSEHVPAVGAAAVVPAVFAALEALAVVLEALALGTLAAGLLFLGLGGLGLMSGLVEVVAVEAAALDATDLSVREALAISGLALGLGAFATQESPPEVAGPHLQQVVDAVVGCFEVHVP
jgi:hypothetical protein